MLRQMQRVVQRCLSLQQGKQLLGNQALVETTHQHLGAPSSSSSNSSSATFGRYLSQLAAAGPHHGATKALPQWPSTSTAASPLQQQQRRGMACSAGLGRAPPKVIEIEFDPADLEAFIKVADAIEEAFPTVIVNGNEEQDGRPGSFEVRTEEGVSVFSRLAGSAVAVPGPDDIIRRITNLTKLPGAGTGTLDENRPFCG